jgi:hypothetical protein
MAKLLFKEPACKLYYIKDSTYLGKRVSRISSGKTGCDTMQNIPISFCIVFLGGEAHG